MLYKHVVNFAETYLSSERLQHSMNTSKCAYDIARNYGVDPERAYLAGLLHDIARDLSAEQILRIATNEGIILRKEERICPFLLHGKVGAIIVKRELGLKDQGVLDAISFHVTGGPDWSRLQQILYLADKIEPDRDYVGASKVRILLEKGDFEGALLECLRENIVYAVRTQGWIVDVNTVVIFNELARRF